VLSFLRDITQLHEAADRQSALEEQLREAQKARSRRSAGWWHRPRLQHLLQVIGGNADLALAPNNETRDRERRSARSSPPWLRPASSQGSCLPSDGGRSWMGERRDQRPGGHPSGDDPATDSRKHPHRFITRGPAPVVTEADRGQMSQVLLNLCLNARTPCRRRKTVDHHRAHGARCHHRGTAVSAASRAVRAHHGVGHGPRMTADVLERSSRFSRPSRATGAPAWVWRWSTASSAARWHISARSEPGRARSLSCCYPARPASGPDERILRRVSSGRPRFHCGHDSARGR